ncbi:group 2 allergen Sui m 2-like protein [Leptotrombidium deliense]|uniref:Group 2 allergen Sui m 2-like protein n=1 Tax=Leptotrombidium deliense TaxID=299467 RepID=A0A443S4B8_9ACAR|nr:group 2 allergen Sui m 2-like protein [Leptotrombidium deliense]
MVIKLVFVTCLLTITSAREIAFTDCGNGEMKSMDITPCESDPCILHKGSNVKVSMKFIPNKNSNTAMLTIGGRANTIAITPPPITMDLCNQLKCPLTAGKEYTIEGTLPVNQLLPTSGVEGFAVLRGDDGQLACVTGSAVITN